MASRIGARLSFLRVLEPLELPVTIVVVDEDSCKDEDDSGTSGERDADDIALPNSVPHAHRHR